MAVNRIPKIQLSEEQLTEFVRDLDDMVEQAKDFHSSWPELHEIYMAQYLTKPEVEEKLTPWPGASNLFLPLGRVIQDGIMSQLHDAMFSNDPFVRVIGENARLDQDAEPLSQFYQYVYKQVVRLKTLGNQWNFMTCLDGTGIVKHRWNRDYELRRHIVPRMTPVYKKVMMDIAGQEIPSEELDYYDEYYEEEITASPASRPSVELTDLNNLFISPDTIPSADGEGGLQYPNCPWYYERLFLTKEQLLFRKHHAGYENVNDELFTRAEQQREVNEMDQVRRDYEGLSESEAGESIEVYEFYMRRVLPAKYQTPDGKYVDQSWGQEGGYDEEIIVTYFPETKKIARIIPLWRLYADGRRPHIVNWYNQIPLSFYGQGVQAKMRMLNAASNSSMNMMVDSGHLYNTPFFFYAPAMTGLLPEIHGLLPGQGVPVNDPRGIQIPRFNHDQSWFLNLINEVQQYAERDGNVTDFTLGRSPEKSSTKTAKGTIALLQMGAVAFGRLASLMVGGYEELFRAIHADYKRHAPDHIFYRVVGQSQMGTSFSKLQRMPRDILTQEVDFEFVLNPNRQQLIQNMQVLANFMMGIPFVAQNPNAVRQLAKQVYDATGTKNFDSVWPADMVPQIGMGMPGMPMQPGQPAQQPPQQMTGVQGGEATPPEIQEIMVQ